MKRSESKPENKHSNRFPDLYGLLGLSPLESDRSRIVHAIKSFPLSQTGATEAGANNSNKLLALAKQHLLTPARKSLYDQRWQKAFNPSVAVGHSTTGTSDWQWNILEEFLPKENPEQAFELAAFILQTQSAFDHQPTEDDLQADYEKLKSLVSGNSAQAAPSLQAEPRSAVRSEASISGSNRIQAGSMTAPYHAAPSVPSELTTKATTRKPASLAREIRRKRERSLVLTAGGVLLSLASVLGAMFFVLNWRKVPQGDSPAVASRPQDDVVQIPVPENKGIPKGSGLPKVSGLDANVELNPSLEPTEDTPQTSDENEVRVVDDKPMPPMDDANQTNTPTMNAMEVSNSPPTTTPASEDVNASTPAAEIPMVELTDAEKAEWSERMIAIRSLLGEQDYGVARQKLDEAAELARTKLQIEQLIRLKSVAALAEQFQQALVQAIEGLEAGETIQVKSTQVSFVDGDAMSVSVRIRGQNKRFELTEIPVGLAWALADLKLDIAHPSSAAMKGVFALFHPASNELVLTQAKDLLASAVAEGAVPPDTISIFDDDYLQ